MQTTKNKEGVLPVTTPPEANRLFDKAAAQSAAGY